MTTSNLTVQCGIQEDLVRVLAGASRQKAASIDTSFKSLWIVPCTIVFIVSHARAFKSIPLAYLVAMAASRSSNLDVDAIISSLVPLVSTTDGLSKTACIQRLRCFRSSSLQICIGSTTVLLAAPSRPVKAGKMVQARKTKGAALHSASENCSPVTGVTVVMLQKGVDIYETVL